MKDRTFVRGGEGADGGQVAKNAGTSAALKERGWGAVYEFQSEAMLSRV